MRVATGVGGTFTDLVFYEYDEATGKVDNVKTEKSYTISFNFEEGVKKTISRANLTPSDPPETIASLFLTRGKLEVFSCKPFKHLRLEI